MNILGNIDWIYLLTAIPRVLAIILLVLIVPQQAQELIKPHDALTKARWRIYYMLIFSLTAATPLLFYQIFLAFGIDSILLRYIAYITGNLSWLGVSLMLWSIWRNYRRKE